jgi:hypothetical protein
MSIRFLCAFQSKLRGLSPRANYTARQSDRLLSAKLVPNFADRKCHVVSVTDPYGRNLGLLDRSRYYFFQVAPQLYSRDCVSTVKYSFSFTQVTYRVE